MKNRIKSRRISFMPYLAWAIEAAVDAARNRGSVRINVIRVTDTESINI